MFTIFPLQICLCLLLVILKFISMTGIEKSVKKSNDAYVWNLKHRHHYMKVFIQDKSRDNKVFSSKLILDSEASSFNLLRKNEVIRCFLEL